MIKMQRNSCFLIIGIFAQSIS